jgi:Protein of unknown function (DUF4199)
MIRHIMKYGAIAGLIIGAFMFATLTAADKPLSMSTSSMIAGFAAMLVALSAVFIGIKHYRDHELGGVIRFWPAFGMGLAMSFIAGVFYIVAWEATLAVTKMDFAGDYANYLIAQEKAKGVSAEALAKVTAELDKFKADYKNPLYRMPMTFTEIFPVGILVSLVSAALLRNARFMPLKRA